MSAITSGAAHRAIVIHNLMHEKALVVGELITSEPWPSKFDLPPVFDHHLGGRHGSGGDRRLRSKKVSIHGFVKIDARLIPTYPSHPAFNRLLSTVKSYVAARRGNLVSRYQSAVSGEIQHSNLNVPAIMFQHCRKHDLQACGSPFVDILNVTHNRRFPPLPVLMEEISPEWLEIG